MDWIHCNNCFATPDTKKSFFVTNCGHMYCQNCEEQCGRSKCKLCGNQCQAIALSSKMIPGVQKFFTDPDEMLKKSLAEYLQISEFQKNHRAKFIAHQRKQMKKFDSVKQEFRKLLKNLKDMDSERKRVSQENESLKKILAMLKTPKPAAEFTGLERGHANYKSPTNLDSTLSSFMHKFDNSNVQRNAPKRITVISPPQNGKMGSVLGTPSPSSYLRQLHLSSAQSNESHSRTFASPISSPADSQSIYFVTQTSPSASHGSNKSNESLKKKKMVVRPFSPSD